MVKRKLMKLTYYDPNRQVRLTGYADTVVLGKTGKEGQALCAVRFGGYPEEVRGLADAIYGGAAVQVEMGGEEVTVQALVKQYRRAISFDGLYSEATLLAEDEAIQVGAEDGEPGEPSDEVSEGLPPRTNYIFCDADDEDALFLAVDRKTSMPLIPAYRDYVLSELKKRGILRPLEVVSLSQRMAAWSLRCTEGDQNIAEVLEDGLKHGDIAVPGEVRAPDKMKGVNSVTGYLNTFGVTMAERIKKLFIPLFDPASEALSPEVLSINDYIKKTAGYSLYDAQLAVAEGIKRRLSKGKVGLIVAECGAGKSKIGSVAIAAAVAGVHAGQQGLPRKKTFNVVLCPSHITKKWVREIQETLPDTFAAVVHSITELERIHTLYEQGTKSCYVIISKERARDGYMRAPAVSWNRRKKGFVCPDCGEVIEMNVGRDGTTYMVPADQRFFRRETRDNHKCGHCGGQLWTALNPNVRADRTPWIKLGEFGWIYRSRAAENLKKLKNPDLIAAIEKVVEEPGGWYPVKGARRAYPLSSYIKRRFRNKIDALILDELHAYNNKSGQGDAMAELFDTARKVVGMTATLINGYSSGIFYLLYRIVPHLMRMDGKEYTKPTRFNAEYGVLQEVYEEKEKVYNSNRRIVKSHTQTRPLPGVSPLVYSRFLLEYAAFLSLSDMGKELPEYEEIPIALDMPEPVAEEYARIEAALKNVLRNDKKAAKKILSAYLNLLTAYPDQPYGHRPICYPESGDPIVEPKDTSGYDALHPKDEKVLEIVRRKIAAGERVLIYTNWTRLDSQEKLRALLTKEGYRTEILHAKVKPERREEWVEARVRSGLQVLITNPTCVETGLDLNDFTTIIFFDVGYKLFTLRQASRRSWRINQTAPRIEVYMLYYKNTMQHKAIRLMASKLAVAGLIEGSFSEEGLAAMSECEDMATIMAKELMLGIKDSVEDVSAAFKRMAILKPSELVGPVFEIDAANAAGGNEPLRAPKTNTDPPVQLVEFTFHASEPPAIAAAAEGPAFSYAPPAEVPNIAPKAGHTVIDQDQQTIFDMLSLPA